ncbi:hypothetical protein [Mesorhizobium sp. 1M-11]|uniref:hypothetical protein n=1 Tax=Mesorhizobium sp. 1M-11 TaxID=1529006 RepID=UPI00137AAB75|nr:hypothetical protein [Mesorhizobium sp. 1M-11]
MYGGNLSIGVEDLNANDGSVIDRIEGVALRFELLDDLFLGHTEFLRDRGGGLAGLDTVDHLVGLCFLVGLDVRRDVDFLDGRARSNPEGWSKMKREHRAARLPHAGHRRRLPAPALRRCLLDMPCHQVIEPLHIQRAGARRTGLRHGIVVRGLMDLANGHRTCLRAKRP